MEAEANATCDGQQTMTPVVMEHIERAGVHSRAALAVYPAISLHPDEVEKMIDYTARLGPALGVKGLMNVQYVIMRPEPSALTGRHLTFTSSRSIHVPAAPSRSSRR